MASTTTGEELLLVQRKHPSHDHPLQLLDCTNDSSIAPSCRLCQRKISTMGQAYTCKERCETNLYYHRLCVEAPSLIDLHPLHPAHPLLLLVHEYDRSFFKCDTCSRVFSQGTSLFRCSGCYFEMDIACALSTSSDVRGHQCGKTSEQITLPLHPHPLTSFTKRHDFFKHSNCFICKESVEEDGYICRLCPWEFIIHKECIRDLCYADGTKAPRVYHGHPMETFIEDDGSRTCASCGSDQSGEFICCEICQVFYHRNCFQVPEIIRYPSHNQDHTLVLFPDTTTQRQCESCSISLKDEIYYRCTSCEFFVHVRCALEVLAYCEEGMSAKIKLSWHKHPLLLCHLSKYASDGCSFCKEESIGPTYLCEEKDCGFLLHKRCTEIESTINHPHHPDHPLTLCKGDDDDDKCYHCKACLELSCGYRYSCDHCSFKLDLKCAAYFPTHKHYLHEHELQRFEELKRMKCNRCGTSNDSPIFRCITCNFNLHEECMELPQVMKNDKVHWHPLTLYETFLEDDTGEYYCEHCEKKRNPRLGAYVCGLCKISMPRIYHIHCVLPELGKLYETRLSYALKELNERIAEKEEEVREVEERLKEEAQKLEKKTRELDVLVKKRIGMLDGDS